MRIYLRLHQMGLGPAPIKAIHAEMGSDVVIIHTNETVMELADIIELVAQIRPVGLEFGAASIKTIQAFCLRHPHIPVYKLNGSKLEHYIWAQKLMAEEIAHFDTVGEWRQRQQAQAEEAQRQYRAESGDHIEEES